MKVSIKMKIYVVINFLPSVFIPHFITMESIHGSTRIPEKSLIRNKLTH